MKHKTVLYICMGCAVVNCITSFILALEGCWSGVFCSPLTTFCCFCVYYLLGHLRSLVEQNANLLDLVHRANVSNGQLLQHIDILNDIIKGEKGENPVEDKSL